ncbi:hypothetical protein BASA81_006137 [Batrachochytrium salamandrivorans]|nr:hypothetical protein BASA81_006137 [Batrachochytrium salamandrivorans]
MKVFAVCGERSGDGILKRVNLNVPFAGAVWTPTVLTAAVPCVFDGPKHLGVMGFGPQVLGKIPWAYRKLGELERWILENDVDVLLTVDSNAFTWRLQQRVRDLVKSVHVCAPSSAWAFRSHSLATRKFAMDRLCTLLPFEHEYWQPSKAGQRVEFVGYFGVETVLDVLGLDVDRSLSLLSPPPPPPPSTNPLLLPHEYLAQAPPPTGTLPKLDKLTKLQYKERLLGQLNAPAHKTKLVALCPGSRLGEIQSSFSLMLQAANQMQDPSIQFVVLGASTTIGQLQSSFPVLKETEYKLAVLCGADAALAVSGTIVTELLACNCPCAVVYNSGGPLTKLVATYKARVKYLSLVNIMAGTQLVPEFFFNNDAALIAKQLARLLEEGVSEQVHSALDRLVVWNGPHPVRPSHMVKRVLLESGG